MSFFKKIVSRSRSGSRSYDDDEYERDASAGAEPRNYDPNRPPSSWKFNEQQQQYQDPRDAPAPSSPYDAANRGFEEQPPQGKMYSSQSQPPTQYASGRNSNTSGMGTGRSSRDGFVDVPSMSQQLPQSVTSGPQGAKIEHSAAPDLLTRAFNEAIRPFSDKIEGLEDQVRDLQAFVDQLEQQRLDVFAWIDKRGLRPDVPPSIAKQMDTAPGLSQASAAESLNSQLDRKITIVNFDLHRLQDDLNDSISSSHFASSMAKFLPDIQRLASLPSGPKYAYDLIIKLVGNLNSHGGVEASRDGNTEGMEQEIEDDRRSRQEFYERMDDELIDVIRLRGSEGENWDVQREVRRLERNQAYLKNVGIDYYFPRALDTLRRTANAGDATSPSMGSNRMSSAPVGAGGMSSTGAERMSSAQMSGSGVRDGQYSGGNSGSYTSNANSMAVGGTQGTASPSRYMQN